MQECTCGGEGQRKGDNKRLTSGENNLLRRHSDGGSQEMVVFLMNLRMGMGDSDDR